MTTKTAFAHLTLWQRPSHYIGATWFDYYPLAGRSRDSDALEESNFRSFFAALKRKAEQLGASEVPNPDHRIDSTQDETIPAFTVERSSHFLVGWVETLLLHESAHPDLLAWADQQLQRLDKYPVFDEADWCRLESELADQAWRDCYDPTERIAYIRRNRSQFDFRDFADLVQCVRGNYFAGYASELLAR